MVPACSSCGKQLEEDTKFAICEECYKKGFDFVLEETEHFEALENKRF